MGVVNLKWRKAIAVKGAWFEKHEEDVVWPEAMRLEPVAGWQCNGDIAYGKVLYNAMLAACKSGDLPHTVQSMNVRSGYKKVFIGHQIVQRVDRFRHDPVYKPRDFIYVKAADFAAWLAAQSEPPSEHIAAWFEAVGAGAGQVATVTNTTPSDAPAKKTRNRKPAWHTVAMPYMKTVFKNGAYSSATVFYRALLTRAGGEDSPFTKSGGALYCPEAGTTVAEGTLGTKWAEIRGR